MAHTQVDTVLSKVLLVELAAGSSATDANVIHLSALADELASENIPLVLSKELLDRVLVARLIESSPDNYPLPPLQYLLGCYTRASDEFRSLSYVRDASIQAAIQDALVAAKDLIVSYSCLLLTAGYIPQPAAAEQRGTLQLLDSMAAAQGKTKDGITPLPAGFLEQVATQQDTESLQAIFEPIAKELGRQAQLQSPLGDYHLPLSCIHQLITIEPIAVALTTAPSWMPDVRRHGGRALQLPGSCWLGPCFSISPVPDALVNAQPSVRTMCFSDIENRRQGELMQSMASLRMAMKQIQGELHLMVKALLGKNTREAMLRWLGEVLEGNEERGKMQSNMMVASSHGLFLNLNSVLLRLCGPFLDPSSPVFWKRVDAAYVTCSSRISFANASKLAATADEENKWREEKQAAGPSPDFHFICESFFMTIKALHLGLVKCITECQDEGRRLQDAQRLLEEMEAGRGAAQGQQQQRLQQVRHYVSAAKELQLCWEATLMDPDMLGEVVAFYQLLCAWLLNLAAGAGTPNLPLPEPCPMQFATLPEYFLEDLSDVLLFVSRVAPQVVSGASMEEIVIFLTVFIGSPAYVKSPYLRSKLSEVLHAWLPDNDRYGRRGFRGQPMGAGLAHLLEGHPLVVRHLVPGLLQLYVDIEFTDRAGQFYIKFNMRQYIGDILHYLWQVPGHQESWLQFAALEGGRGPYLRFANMLINDSIYLLDEALKKLKELKELEVTQADAAAWAALSAQEQGEREGAIQQTGEHLRSLLYLASGTINSLHGSTERVQRPFLLPEMVERIAGMLNYFLLYLTGPERRSLKVKDPEKYHFKPKELVAKICQVYLHLASADTDGDFAAAIAADARSYRAEMFSEAAAVLRQFALLPEREIAALGTLAERAAQAAEAGQAEDELMADVPDEFLDPIQYTLMRDPVRMPTSGVTVDRASIMRHLLSDQRDPINREKLTPEMLVPDVELKKRIQTWLKEQKAKQAA